MKQAGKLPRLYVTAGPLGAQGASNIYRLHEVPSPSFLGCEMRLTTKDADPVLALSVCGFPSEGIGHVLSRRVAEKEQSTTLKLKSCLIHQMDEIEHAYECQRRFSSKPNSIPVLEYKSAERV
jgi:hypothetical protein